MIQKNLNFQCWDADREQKMEADFIFFWGTGAGGGISIIYHLELVFVTLFRQTKKQVDRVEKKLKKMKEF